MLVRPKTILITEFLVILTGQASLTNDCEMPQGIQGPPVINNDRSFKKKKHSPLFSIAVYDDEYSRVFLSLDLFGECKRKTALWSEDLVSTVTLYYS